MESTVGEAGRNISKLIEVAEPGERVVITRRGKPVVELVKVRALKRRPIGFLRGQVREIDPDWWRPITDLSVTEVPFTLCNTTLFT
jgi:prevent-host-death family protein